MFEMLLVDSCFTGNLPVLLLVINTNTLPDNETVHTLSENNLFLLLQSDEVLQSLAQTLSEEFETYIKLNGVRKGSIKVDMVLGDLSRLEYIKEMSDKGVLSSIVDRILITSEFISSCQADDVTLDVVVNEESYQQLKSRSGECNTPKLRTVGIFILYYNIFTVTVFFKMQNKVYMKSDLM